MKETLIIFIALWGNYQALSQTHQTKQVPTELRCDLIEHTDRVFINGEISQISFDEIDNIIEPVQLALIESKQPVFSWIIEDIRNHTMQTAFHIQIGISPKKMKENNRYVWSFWKRI